MIAAPLGLVNASLIGTFMIERPGVGHRRKYIMISRKEMRGFDPAASRATHAARPKSDIGPKPPVCFDDRVQAEI